MNSEFPRDSREELELRVTALLLGELSAAEANAVREALAKDPALTKLHDDLKQTIHIVRQATANAGESVTEQAAQPQLSEERRKKLLTHFAIPPLKESDRKPKPLFQLGLLEWAAVLAIIAAVAAISFRSTRAFSPRLATQTDILASGRLAEEPLSRTWGLKPEPTMEAVSPLAQTRGPSNVHSLNVVGYTQVDPSQFKAVENRFQISGQANELAERNGKDAHAGRSESAFSEYFGEQQRRLAATTSANGLATAAPKPAKPASPIVLPALQNTDGDTITAALPEAGDSKLPDVGSYGASQVGRPIAPENKQYFGLAGAAPLDGVERVPLQLQYPAPILKGSPEDLPSGPNIEPLGEKLANPSDPAKQLFPERYGLGVRTEARNGRGESAARAILTPTAPPPSSAAGTDDAGFVAAPAPVQKLVAASPAIAGSPLSVAPGELSSFVFAPDAASANKVPTLGNVPMTRSFYRSVVVAQGGAGGGSQSAQPTDALARMRPEANLHANFAEITTNSWSEPAFNYSLDLNNTGDLRVAPEGKDHLAESRKLGWAEGTVQEFNRSILKDALRNSSSAPKMDQGPVNLGEEFRRPASEINIAGYVGALDKSAENFGAIVLPAAPEENGKPAAAEKSRLATGTFRSMSLLDSDRAVRANEAPALVQEGKQLLEAGRAAEAEAKLKAALEKDPKSGAANYYLSFANESQTREADRRSGGTSKSAAIQVTLPEQQSAGKKLEKQTEQAGSGMLGAADVSPRKLALPEVVTEPGDKTRPYYDKQRELEELMVFDRILNMKLEAEKTDRALPKTSMVEIMDRAQPAKDKTGFWRNLGAPVGGSFASTARVKVQQAVTDIEGMAGSRMNMGYDPYFIQTEFEAVQSDAVLGKVVDALKLDEAWAAKGGGEKLNRAEAIGLLKDKLDLKPVRNTNLVEIQAKSDKPDEAAKIANAVAEAYKDQRQQERTKLASGGIATLEGRSQEQQDKIRRVQAELEALREQLKISDAEAGATAPASPKEEDRLLRRSPTNAPIPQPEIQASENNFSTFSLNVSDVSFKLAAASLEKGQMPDAASVRSEEFINAFDYRDPEPAAGAPIAFAWERARYPFAHNRDLLRFSLKTAAAGRQAGRPLNIVLLLDNSGSMERADRVSIIREALRVLASQLQPQDKLSVITFSRTARLVADGISGDKAGELAEQVSGLTPQGGTNLEDAMNLAYQTASRHYLANGINRVVLLTDGAANLGNVEPESLKQKVEAQRKQGIALDCFGIGWEGLNDDLLEVLSRNGDGRYGFINSPEEAASDFAGQLAGALKVAASDVKVQVEFNPKRVTAYRQIGYAKHQLTKEQFRDNTVDAAEIAAQEAGNALYTVEVNPAGDGPLGTVRVRYKIHGTTEYREQAWDVPYAGNAASLEQSSPAMRLAATASAFSEWLVASPFAGEVTLDRLISYLGGVPEIYGADARPKKLEWMIRQAKSLQGK